LSFLVELEDLLEELLLASMPISEERRIRGAGFVRIPEGYKKKVEIIIKALFTHTKSTNLITSTRFSLVIKEDYGI
jgi:hypothetical protein